MFMEQHIDNDGMVKVDKIMAVIPAAWQLSFSFICSIFQTHLHSTKTD
jgi:hypothetical protein